MKMRQIIVEVIYLILILAFFYEGVYKIAYWSSYSRWLSHAPLLNPAWVVLTYAIPLGEIALAATLILPSYRVQALYAVIVLLIAFVLWVMSWHLFTGRIFWPFRTLWKNPTWMQKISISMGLCWLAFIGILFSKEMTSEQIKPLLRKTAANAQ